MSGSIESAVADFGSWMGVEAPARPLRVPELVDFVGVQAEGTPDFFTGLKQTDLFIWLDDMAFGDVWCIKNENEERKNEGQKPNASPRP